MDDWAKLSDDLWGGSGALSYGSSQDKWKELFKMLGKYSSKEKKPVDYPEIPIAEIFTQPMPMGQPQFNIPLSLLEALMKR